MINTEGDTLSYAIKTYHLLWLYLALVSLVTFCMYGIDKRRAANNRSRIPENTLHLLTLIGGTFGALLAQRLFHHKTRKLQFQLIFMLIALAQCAALLFLYKQWKS